MMSKFVRVCMCVCLTIRISCADPESFVRGGTTQKTLFLAEEGREDPYTTISEPSSARQRNAIQHSQSGLVAYDFSRGPDQCC